MPAKRRGPETRARAEAVAVAHPGARKPVRRVSLAPGRRSLLAGLGIVLVAGGLYAVARQTSVFAIRSIHVGGAPAPVAAQVERALAPYLGRSLVGLDGGAVVRRVDSLPTVVGAVLDRSFPHTLRVVVTPERPVAVLRHGPDAWLVSARARLIARVGIGAHPKLPRIWLGTNASIGPAGAFLAPDTGAIAARALAFASGFPDRIQTATDTGGTLQFQLSSGVSLRLGDSANLPLKLAVARRALRALPAGTTYLDVSLPGRPVSGASSALPALTTTVMANPQVSTGG
ncbi:MAG: FtsQ-type POTRA domain-containing protein [Actinobacteria bacterium]|nr:FtsQ-type POTRA domain-containing protein [Actinomycetota bacterium]